MEKITSSDIRFPDLTEKRFNKRFSGKPEYFYLPESTSDVVAAVQEAIDAQKRIVVRSGGYCLEGFVSDPSVQVLIDMSLMKDISSHRMALDYTDKITKLVLLDIVPTSWAFANVDKEIATAAFNWFFSIQSDDLLERLITAEPEFYIQWLLDDFAGKKDILRPDAVAEYKRCFDKASIYATCEEFRASATIDLEHDEVDENKKISCPAFILWSATGMWAKYDILKLWQTKANNVKGKALNCGHFLQEENPIQTAKEIIEFLL